MNSDIKPILVGGVGEINFGKQYRQGNRIYDADSIAMACLASPVGNAGGFSYLYRVEGKMIKELIKEHNRTAKHQQDLLQHHEDVCRCIPAGTHGSTPHLTKTVVSEQPLRIRKLTPKECFRLMGFDDEDFEKAATTCSNTQLYKQSGNSICVPVIEYIITALLECGALESGGAINE